MTKIFTLVRSHADMSREQFAQFWKTQYLADFLRIPGVQTGLQRIVHNRRLAGTQRSDPENPSVDWTGVAETYYDTEAQAAAVLSNPLLKSLDDKYSGQLPELSYLHVREIPQWDNHPATISQKMFGFFHPSAAMTRAQSQQYWSVGHVAVGAKLDLAKYGAKYVQNHTLADYHAVNPVNDFTGCAELWFASDDDIAKLWSDPEKVRALNADEAVFSNRQTTAFVFADEELVYSRT